MGVQLSPIRSVSITLNPMADRPRHVGEGQSCDSSGLKHSSAYAWRMR